MSGRARDRRVARRALHRGLRAANAVQTGKISMGQAVRRLRKDLRAQVWLKNLTLHFNYGMNATQLKNLMNGGRTSEL